MMRFFAQGLAEEFLVELDHGRVLMRGAYLGRFILAIQSAGTFYPELVADSVRLSASADTATGEKPRSAAIRQGTRTEDRRMTPPRR